MNILFSYRSQTHPDLKLWQKPWKLAGRSRMKSAALSDSKTLSSASSETSLHKELLSSSFTDYISSDHCYQKPIVLHQVLEPRLELKTWEVEDRLYNTNSMIKNEHSIQPTQSTSCNKLSNHNKVRSLFSKMQWFKFKKKIFDLNYSNFVLCRK